MARLKSGTIPGQLFPQKVTPAIDPNLPHKSFAINFEGSICQLSHWFLWLLFCYFLQHFRNLPLWKNSVWKVFNFLIAVSGGDFWADENALLFEEEARGIALGGVAVRL